MKCVPSNIHFPIIFFLSLCLHAFMTINMFERARESYDNDYRMLISFIDDRLEVLVMLVLIQDHFQSPSSENSSSSLSALLASVAALMMGSQISSNSFLFSSYSSFSASGLLSRKLWPYLMASSKVASSSLLILPFSFSGSLRDDFTE